jgi:succinoglycan biosynthesis protein ExoM
MSERIEDAGAPILPRVCVCICTCKRPLPLRRLLDAVEAQETGGLFAFSIVVADNDAARSAEAIVEAFRATSFVAVKYCVETERGIAHARNRVLRSAEGEYLALIDDDEFPAPGWLLQMFEACNRLRVDGALGPAIRFYDSPPPAWLTKCRFLNRPTPPTGTPVRWRDSATSNVFLRSSVVAGDPTPFRPELRAGEDQDFFRRKIEEGFRFVWCAEAAVMDVIPPARWRRSYLIRRALLSGGLEPKMADFGPRSFLKSAVAVPLYAVLLPFALLLGQHRFMDLLVRFCDHLGKVLATLGIHLIREAYVSE